MAEKKANEDGCDSGTPARMSARIESHTIENIALELVADTPELFRIGLLIGHIRYGSLVMEDVYIPRQNSTCSASAIQPDDLLLAMVTAEANGFIVGGLIQYTSGYPPYTGAGLYLAREQLAEAGVPSLCIIVNSNHEFRIEY
jgi:hypothetical protein